MRALWSVVLATACVATDEPPAPLPVGPYSVQARDLGHACKLVATELCGCSPHWMADCLVWQDSLCQDDGLAAELWDSCGAALNALRETSCEVRGPNPVGDALILLREGGCFEP